MRVSGGCGRGFVAGPPWCVPCARRPFGVSSRSAGTGPGRSVPRSLRRGAVGPGSFWQGAMPGGRRAQGTHPPCAQSLGGAPGQGEVLPVDAGAVVPIGRGVEAVISRLRVRGSPWRGFACTAFFDSAADTLQRFFVATGFGCDSATGCGRPSSLFRIHPLQRSQRRLETFVLGRFASFGVVGVPLGVESCRNVFR